MKSTEERAYIIAQAANEAAKKLAKSNEHFVFMVTIDRSGLPFVSKHQDVSDEAFVSVLETLLEGISKGRTQRISEPTIN